MAQRRMFAMTIVDSDAFLNMPVSAQNLYFALGMRADDEGFINGPEKIVRICKAKKADLELLNELKFVITFESGIVVIKHWKMNNYIAPNRMKPTVYKEEQAQLEEKANGSYTKRRQNADKLNDQVSIGKVRLDEVRIEEDSIEEHRTPEDRKPAAAEDLAKRFEAIKQKPMTEQLTEEEIEVIRQYEKAQRGAYKGMGIK